MIYLLAIILYQSVFTDFQPTTEQSGPFDTQINDQISYYIGFIERSENIDANVWAILEFIRKNPDKRDFILSKLNGNVRWVDYVNKDVDIINSIQLLSIYFDSERLQLYLQLLDLQPNLAKSYLNEFYKHSNKNELKALNFAISQRKEVSLEEIKFKNWDFTLFLLTNFLSFKHADKNTFLNYYLNWIENFTGYNSLDSYSKQLFDLFRFQIYYQSQRDDLIAKHQDKFYDLDLIPPTDLKRNMYRAFDYSMYITGNINKSLEIQRDYSIPLSRFLNDESTIRTIKITQGAYLYRLGKYHEAKSIFDEILQNEDNLSPNLKTRVLNNLGLVHFMLGENDNYIKNQFAALDLAKEQENDEFTIRIYRNLFQFYRKNQDWDRALENLDRGIEIANRIDNSEMRAELNISMAVYYYESENNYQMAHQHLDIAQESNEDINNKVIASRLLFERSIVNKLQNNYEQSYQNLNQALDLASEENNTRDYLQAIVKMMEIDYLKGDFNTLRRNLIDYHSNDLSVLNFNFLAQANHLEAQLAIHDGNLAKAEQILDQTVDLVLDRARNTSQIETGYWSVENEYLQVFESYADFLIANGRREEALRFLDRVKTINDASMVQNPLVKAEILTEDELNREQQIDIQMDNLRKKMLTASPSDRMNLQNEIEVLSVKKREITSKLNNRALESPKAVWVLQRHLRPDEMLVHLSLIGNNLYISNLTDENLNVKKLVLSRDIDELFNSAINSMVSGRTDLHKLYSVYSYLGFDNIPDRINTITVMPDSYLHQLPLDVLPVTRPLSPVSYGSASYLVERYRVRYLNNLNELTVKSSNNSYEFDFAGFGISDFSRNGQQNLVSLPQAPLEVETTVGKLDRFDIKNAILETEATPSAFRSIAPSSRILHMATHSEVSESDPLFSRLFLNPDEGVKDNTLAGQLFAYELFNLNLRNELVMLNSCESGAGTFLQGSGIMGISRALRYAGAQSLVLNGWSVNDSFASEFAIRFYDHLNEGHSKSEALRLAKIHFIKNRNANPHFWGPYMLNGDDKPLIQKTGNFELQVALASLLLFGITWTARRRKPGRTH